MVMLRIREAVVEISLEVVVWESCHVWLFVAEQTRTIKLIDVIPIDNINPTRIPHVPDFF